MMDENDIDEAEIEAAIQRDLENTTDLDLDVSSESESVESQKDVKVSSEQNTTKDLESLGV